MRFPLIVKPKEGYFEDVVDSDDEQIFGIMEGAGYRDNMVELVRRANAYDDLIKLAQTVADGPSSVPELIHEASRLLKQNKV